MSGAHTPGPWLHHHQPPIMQSGAGTDDSIWTEEDETLICLISGVSQANARLIATAPELLEALKRAVMFPGSPYHWALMAHAIIAKAEGRTLDANP